MSMRLRVLAGSVATGVLLVLADQAKEDVPVRPEPVVLAAVPVVDAPREPVRLALDLAELDRRLGQLPEAGNLSISITDLTTGSGYDHGSGLRTATASIVKVDILAALMLKVQGAGRALTRTEKALGASMIQNSDNEAADALYRSIGGAHGLTKANQDLGLRDTLPAPSWGSSSTSARDQVRLLEALVSDRSKLSPSSRKYVLDLMAGISPAQFWGVSAAARVGDTVAIKNGWVPRTVHGNLWTVNSMGRISGHGHDFLIAVISERHPTMPAGVAAIERVTEIVVRAFTPADP